MDLSGGGTGSGPSFGSLADVGFDSTGQLWALTTTQLFRVDVNEGDILTNLPYVDGCHLCFDHHHSESIRNEGSPANHILDAHADSAARVVYGHFGGVAASTFEE